MQIADWTVCLVFTQAVEGVKLEPVTPQRGYVLTCVYNYLLMRFTCDCQSPVKVFGGDSVLLGLYSALKCNTDQKI